MLVCVGLLPWVFCRGCNLKTLYIWDLDGTTIDSSHRALTNSQGGIDLNNWRGHTAKQILQDSPTQLTPFMKKCIADKNAVNWICTSRVLSAADYRLIDRLGIRTPLILSRDEGDNREDVPYKMAKIKRRLNLPTIPKRRVVFDDRADVREAFRDRLGFTAPDPYWWHLYK